MQPPPPDTLAALLGRPATGGRAPRPYLPRLASSGPAATGASIASDADGGPPTPAFALAFNAVYCDTRLLAVAGEDGYVSVVDTGAPLPAGLCAGGGGGADADASAAPPPAPRAQWLCHANAVFDVAWARDDTRLLTGSGDATVGVWDTLDAARVARAAGHTGSVKAVAPRPDDGARGDVFASGGRDGALLLWDARVGGGGAAGGDLAPVARVADAHGALPGRRRRRGAPPPPHSVTAIAWLPPDNVLVTGGADGAVRGWDLRALRRRPGSGASSSAAVLLQPVAELWPVAPRTHGVCGLALHRGSGRLAAVLHGAGVALLHPTLAGPATLLPAASPDFASPPPSSSAAAAPASFYVKAAFSGDGTGLVAGGGDGVARVWDVGAGARLDAGPVARLAGHAAEVTAVAWCPSDPGEIVTASDDACVRVWRVGGGAGSPPLSPVRRAPPPLWRQAAVGASKPARAAAPAPASAAPSPASAAATPCAGGPHARPPPPPPPPRRPFAPRPGVATPAQPLTGGRTAAGGGSAARGGGGGPAPPSTRRVRMAQRSLFEFLGPAAVAAAGGRGALADRLTAAADDNDENDAGKRQDEAAGGGGEEAMVEG